MTKITKLPDCEMIEVKMYGRGLSLREDNYQIKEGIGDFDIYDRDIIQSLPSEIDRVQESLPLRKCNCCGEDFRTNRRFRTPTLLEIENGFDKYHRDCDKCRNLIPSSRERKKRLVRKIGVNKYNFYYRMFIKNKSPKEITSIEEIESMIKAKKLFGEATKEYKERRENILHFPEENRSKNKENKERQQTREKWKNEVASKSITKTKEIIKTEERRINELRDDEFEKATTETLSEKILRIAMEEVQKERDKAIEKSQKLFEEIELRNRAERHRAFVEFCEILVKPYDIKEVSVFQKLWLILYNHDSKNMSEEELLENATDIFYQAGIKNLNSEKIISNEDKRNLVEIIHTKVINKKLKEKIATPAELPISGLFLF